MKVKPPKRPPSLKARLLATEAPPPWGQMTALGAFVITILCFIVGAFLALPFGIADATLEARWLALNLGALLTIIYFAIRMRQPPQRAALRLSPRRGGPALLYFIAWGLLLSFALDLLGQALIGRIRPPLELIDTYAARAELSVASALLAALFMLLGQPLVEEVLLRGLLYPAMRARLSGAVGLGMALLSSALAHTVLHNALYGGLGSERDITQLWLVIITPLIAGFAFGIARAASQSTLATILVHAGAGGGALLKLILL